MKYIKIALVLTIFSLIACINNNKKEKIVFRVSKSQQTFTVAISLQIYS